MYPEIVHGMNLILNVYKYKCNLLYHDLCPTGNSYQFLEYQYRIGWTTIGMIIPDTRSALREKCIEV